MTLFLVGFICGALAMWFYFAMMSGLHRTRGEFYLAKGIGDDAIDLLCEEFREEVTKHFKEKR